MFRTTGEYRCPRKGDWYDLNGSIVRATCSDEDYTFEKIIYEEVLPISIENTSYGEFIHTGETRRIEKGEWYWTSIRQVLQMKHRTIGEYEVAYPVAVEGIEATFNDNKYVSTGEFRVPKVGEVYWSDMFSDLRKAVFPSTHRRIYKLAERTYTVTLTQREVDRLSDSVFRINRGIAKRAVPK